MSRSSSRPRKSKRRHYDDNSSGEIDESTSDSALNNKMTSAFLVDGSPDVPKIPVSGILKKHGKFCGLYLFKEDFEGDPAKYYESNKKHAWSIVSSTRIKADAYTYEKTGNLPTARLANARVYNTPISALWQSSYGPFVLFPRPDYAFATEEEVAKEDWFPSVTWVEYLTKESSASKYNIRNATNWDKFQRDLERLQLRTDISASETEHRPSGSSAGAAVTINFEPPAPNQPATRKSAEARPVLTAAAKKVTPQKPSATVPTAAAKKVTPQKQLTTLTNESEPDHSSSTVRTAAAKKASPQKSQADRSLSTAPMSPAAHPVTEDDGILPDERVEPIDQEANAGSADGNSDKSTGVFRKSDDTMTSVEMENGPYEFSSSEEEVQVVEQTEKEADAGVKVIDPKLLSKRPGGAGFKPATFGQPALLITARKDDDPEFDPDEEESDEESEDDTTETDADGNTRGRKGKPAAGKPRAGRGRGISRGRARGARGGGRSSGVPAKKQVNKKVEHPHIDDVTTYSPIVPSPSQPTTAGHLNPVGTPETVAVANNENDEIMEDAPGVTPNTSTAAASRNLFHHSASSTRQDVRSYLSNNVDPAMIGNLPACFPSEKIMLGITNMLRSIDQKLDLALLLIPKDDKFFFAPRGSDFLLRLTQAVQGFTSFPLRAIEEAEILENISAHSDLLTYVLIVFLSSVIAGGNVAYTSGFLWDKLFSAEFSEEIAWASIGEANQAGVKRMGRESREKYLFRRNCPHLTRIIYHVIRRKTSSLGFEMPSVFLMNEHLKLARAVSAGRAGQNEDIDSYTDQTSRIQGVFKPSMFCDDLQADVQVASDEYHEDLEGRHRKCLTCSNRKHVAKPPERKRDPNVKDPNKDPIPRPNRRVNNTIKIEYEGYAAFAHKYIPIDLKVLEDMHNGVNFLDSDAYRHAIEEACNTYHEWLVNKENEPVHAGRRLPAGPRTPSPSPPPPSPPPPPVGRPLRARPGTAASSRRDPVPAIVSSSSSESSSDSDKDDSEPQAKKRRTTSNKPATPASVVSTSSSDSESDTDNAQKKAKKKAKKAKKKAKKAKKKAQEKEKSDDEAENTTKKKKKNKNKKKKTDAAAAKKARKNK